MTLNAHLINYTLEQTEIEMDLPNAGPTFNSLALVPWLEDAAIPESAPTPPLAVQAEDGSASML